MKGYKFLIPIALVVLFFASVFALANNKKTQNSEYELFMSKARKCMEQEIYVDAEAYYKEAINRKSTIEAYLGVGEAYKASGSTRKGIQWGETIIAVFPNESAGYEFLMSLYVEAGQYEKAFQLAEKIDHKGIKSQLIEGMISQIEYKYVLISSFDDASVFSQNLCPVKVKESWGFANQKGETAIDCRFVKVGFFNNDIAPVVDAENNAYYVDKKGNKKIVVDVVCPVVELGMYVDGIFPLFDGKEWAYYNDNNQLLFGGFDFATTMGNGLAAVVKNGVWTLIDREGKQVTDSTYTGIVYDSKGIVTRNERIFVKIGYDYFLIDKSGQQYGSLYEDARLFNDSTYAAVKINGKWGFINKEGEIVIEPQYEDAYSFSNGLAAVKVNGLWGYIDSDGQIVIAAQFDGAKEFNTTGSAFVLTKGKWKLLRLIKQNY